MANIKRIITLTLALIWMTAITHAATIRGLVTDRETGEPLIGAAVVLAGTTTGAVTDMDGRFELVGVRNGSWQIVVSYVSYRTETLTVTVDGVADVDVRLTPDALQLDGVTVTAETKRNTEAALLAVQRQSLVMQTGVSAGQITRTQDKDASEVIRRVPGISIIEDKFVMVRGLNQRYNNVWINNCAVPSSEADSRAFSFDIIPSSQLDNIMVVKSAAPEYPADFTGGFILINTKDVPNKNSFSISAGGSYNDRTNCRGFYAAEGSGTDFLGFDNGFRGLTDGIGTQLVSDNGEENNYSLTNNHLNNDWSVRKHTPLANFNLSANFTLRLPLDNGAAWAMLGALNYSNGYQTYSGMSNNLFGGYDTTHDRSNYLHQYTDDQYNHNVRLGIMYNVSYISANGNHRFELKNIFNQLGKDRYTERYGYNAQSEYEHQAEYYYQSRSTYSGQLTGKHTITANDRLDWSAGYSYANRNMPDRRRYIQVYDDDTGSFYTDKINDISREFSRLDEHIMSANANYVHDFHFSGFNPELKAGAYAEYRTRTYDTRQFIYNWNSGSLPSAYAQMDVVTELLQEENYGDDKLSLIEKVDYTNSYSGTNSLYAGYVAVNLPLGKLNIYAGVRFEHDRMKLVRNTKKYEESHSNLYYTYDDFFPSANITYRLNDKYQLRLSYGRTVNRPEFREVSTSVFYDFDLASDVQGNTSLEPAYIDNFDFSLEFYPGAGELLSVSLFYKRFRNPIEWVYTVSGGTDYIYSYENAKSADNYGIEADIRKSLDFIGLPDFSLNVNAALIKSKVHFDESSTQKNRQMQGQSPYLINAGLFYQKKGWGAAVLYNRIGKRIVGVGRSMGTGESTVSIPDSYEMPRDVIDISLSKQLGAHIEIKAAVRDLLAEKVKYLQFQDTDGGEVEQTVRQFKPGRNISVSVTWKP